MKVQLFTESMAHGAATRTAGKYKPIISFRKNRPLSQNQAANYGGDTYTITTAHEFSVGNIFKFGGKYYKIKAALNSMAYIYQYTAEVKN